MAFWKKSEDPWDMDPGKRKKQTGWYETHASVETPPAPPVPEVVEKAVENVENSEKEQAEVCPRCGGEMAPGRLSSGRDDIVWRDGAEPERFVDFLMEGGERIRPDRAWRCRKCNRVVFTLKDQLTPWTEKTSFHEYVDQWNEREEREKKAGSG